MYQKFILLLVLLGLSLSSPLNSAPQLASTEPILNEQSQTEKPVRKAWFNKAKKDKKQRAVGKPVLPAIALSLGILAVVTFILAGLPGIFIGLAAIVVGSVVLTRRNGYSKTDRLMARIGVLLGSLFSLIGILIIIAILEPSGVNLEGLEPLIEHVLG